MTSQPPPTGNAPVANVPVESAPVADSAMAARRASARRTALIVAGLALAVYVGFFVLNLVAQ